MPSTEATSHPQPTFARVLVASAALTALVMTLLSWLSLAQMLFLSLAVWGVALEARRRVPGDEEQRSRERKRMKIRVNGVSLSKNDSSSAISLGNSDSDSDFDLKRRRSPLGSAAANDNDEDFQDVEEKKDEFQDVKEMDGEFQEVIERKSEATLPPTSVSGGAGLKLRSVKASGEELVRQLQELERNSRVDQSRIPQKRLVMLEESLSSFQSIDEAEEEDDVFGEEGSGVKPPKPAKRGSKKSRNASLDDISSNGSEVMIYDTTKRRTALLLHESEASSTMIADTAGKLLERMGFRVKMVKSTEKDADSGSMMRQACQLLKENSKIRRSDCLLIAFLPTIKITLTFDELRPPSSASRSSSTSSFTETILEDESDLFSTVMSTRSSRGRPTLIFDFRQDEPLNPTTSEMLPEHCFLAVGQARRATQAVSKNVTDRLQAAFIEMQDLDSVQGDKKWQKRTLSTLKYPVVICEKPCFKHSPECPY